jgi:hypothetical protein
MTQKKMVQSAAAAAAGRMRRRRYSANKPKQKDKMCWEIHVSRRTQKKKTIITEEEKV